MPITLSLPLCLTVKKFAHRRCLVKCLREKSEAKWACLSSCKGGYTKLWKVNNKCRRHNQRILESRNSKESTVQTVHKSVPQLYHGCIVSIWKFTKHAIGDEINEHVNRSIPLFGFWVVSLRVFTFVADHLFDILLGFFSLGFVRFVKMMFFVAFSWFQEYMDFRRWCIRLF